MKINIIRDREGFVKRNIRKGDTVLDIGYVGWINFHQEIMSMGDVYGLDLLESDIEKTFVGSAERMVFDSDMFDLVIAGEVIEHVLNPYQFLLECRRVCKNNGKIIITTPNIHNLWWNRKALLNDIFEYHPQHIYAWDLPLLIALCKKPSWGLLSVVILILLLIMTL